MELHLLHLPINILKTIFSTITSHLHIFKSPPHSTIHVIISPDSSSPSLLRVPVHVITACIKEKVPVIPYSESTHRGTHTAVCMVCLDRIDGSHPIRELLNCEHVFHLECLDNWIDVGQVNCPLCRSMLLPPKKLLSSITDAFPVM